MIYHWSGRLVAQKKTDLLGAIESGHIIPGEVVGLGFPFIHNVYRVNDKGDLNFVYHYHLWSEE